MTRRPTQAQHDAANALLAAVAERLGATVECGYMHVGDDLVAVTTAAAGVAVLSVAGFDGHTVIEAMPAAFRTPNGRRSQVQEVVDLIRERQSERERRAPEMARLAAASAARGGQVRDPGDSHYSDGSEVPCD